MSAGAILLSGVLVYAAGTAGALVAATRGNEWLVSSGLLVPHLVWFGLTGLAIELSGSHGSEYYYLDIWMMLGVPVALLGTAVAAWIAHWLLGRSEERDTQSTGDQERA